MSIELPKDHPRYHSLLYREAIVEGMDEGIVAKAGLIAHGRGESFDYLVGETTNDFALEAIDAAARAFLRARHPVISVNGNVAVLCPSDLVELSDAARAALEVNLFYRTPGREELIEAVLRKAGAREVFGVGAHASAVIPELGSERRRVDPRGIAAADLVFVPLEDGDRTEALVAMGKTVVTVDLNPLSRTARMSSITIVDNIVRALPALVRRVCELSAAGTEAQPGPVWDNGACLAKASRHIAARLEQLAAQGLAMQPTRRPHA